MAKGVKAYDWDSLKQEYITGNEPELSAYFKKKGIKENTWKKRTRTWHEAYTQQKQEEDRQALKLVTMKNAKAKAEALTKQLDLTQWLMKFGYENITIKEQGQDRDIIKTKNLSQAIRALIAGMSIQAKILDLYEPGETSSPADIEKKPENLLSESDQVLVKEIVERFKKYQLLEDRRLLEERKKGN